MLDFGAIIRRLRWLCLGVQPCSLHSYAFDGVRDCQWNAVLKLIFFFLELKSYFVVFILMTMCFPELSQHIIGVMCMSLSSKFFPESTGEKNCENWSIFSEDMGKVQ